MNFKLKHTLIVTALSIFATILFPLEASSLPYRVIRIQIPAYSKVTASNGIPFKFDGTPGHYSVHLKKGVKFPFTLTIHGAFGGKVIKEIKNLRQLRRFKMKTEIIENQAANPEKISILPKLCPRLVVEKDKSGNNLFYYDGCQDALNHFPTVQLLDPDSFKGIQYKAFAEIDKKNILLLKQVRLTYDYEDTQIIDYEGPHPLTGKPHLVHEGQGGFYANLHYAVVPYSRGISKMDRQTLLHLAQGSLTEINRTDLRPKLRTHSFIPGPFLSRTGYLYDMCEWGDTTYQAPEQILKYENMALWDWDYSVKNVGHILLIVWEGDEEDWLYQGKLIHPFYLTDDLVGIFEMKRKDTLEPLTLTNDRGDFQITVQTGDM